MPSTFSLGPRLQRVASLVPDQAKLGDIGTDHAYLPIYLWEEQRIRQAIAVDIHKGPYQSAQKAVQNRGLADAIQVRLGDGLIPIQPGEVDTLTLAGMGGNTMLEIFAARPEVMNLVNDLILQPQGAEGKVRKTLLRSGWLLRDEQLAAEEGRIYSVMAFSRKKGISWEKLQLLEEEWFRRLQESKRSLSDIANTKINEGKINQETVDIEAVDLETVDIKAFEKREIFSQIFWDLGPLIIEHPVIELKYLIDERIRPLQFAIREMKKSGKVVVRHKMKQHETMILLLKEMSQCLFPSV